MAASNWGTDRRLDDSLFTTAYEFDFFQAVRLLTAIDEERCLGTSPQTHEVARFRVHNSLAFPASAIASIETRGDATPQVAVTFLGMTGLQGTLPVSYTEIAVDRECFGDHSFPDFLDLFNHRLIQLFFEAWKKHHFVIGYEEAQRHDREDAFTSYLFDLIGMGTGNLKGRLALPDVVLLRYCGLLAQRPHSADALRGLLHDYFDVPVKVEQFVGKWHALEAEELCQLGANKPSSQLGMGAVAGSDVWSRQALVRIVFGPLNTEEFRSFLPNGEGFALVAALTRWFLGNSLEFEIQPILCREEVPASRLSGHILDPQLGWCAWLTTGGLAADARDAIFREDEQVAREV